YDVIAKIEKYNFLPGHCYYLIIKDRETGEYDVIERISYNHITETYGYLYDNKYVDSLNVGSTIPKGNTVTKSTSFDENDNRMDGVNLETPYMSCELTKEDGIILSETGAYKLRSPLLKKVQVVVNDNDIPLNIFGNADFYKSFPNVGEEVTNGILFASRREKKEESLFTQAISRLQQTMMSDTTYPVHGKVIDIDIYCNNPEALEDSYYNSQLKFYYDKHIEFIRDFSAIVGNLIAQGGKCSYELQKQYYNYKKILEGGQYIKDKPFSNIIIEFVVLEESIVKVGDKISNRHGGKGVVSAILPDDKMPMLENGKRLECIFNSSTCVNRENAGQLFETSINFMGSRIVDYVGMTILHEDECIEEYLRFLKMLSPEMGNEIEKYLNNLSEMDKQFFIQNLITDQGIMTSMRPITECMNLDTLSRLYKEFPYITQCKLMVPQRNSNGDIRYIQARRRMVVGKQYIYRLKQYAEEKMSAVSLSATNIKNENSRNSSKKSYKSIHAKTPIRFGEMETGDLIHLGVENVIINLMLHSTSPHGRRLAEDLLTGDPFDIDIKLDDMAKNRSVEILNAYLLTMGLELKFSKIPKKKQQVMMTKILTFLNNPDNHGLRQVMYNIPQDEHFNGGSYLEGFTNNNPMRRKIMTYKK
ncbi:MAG: hypothetical protein ACRDD7_02200, partial [Peptostreptococcaceae bacterium]